MSKKTKEQELSKLLNLQISNFSKARLAKIMKLRREILKLKAVLIFLCLGLSLNAQIFTGKKIHQLPAITSGQYDSTWLTVLANPNTGTPFKLTLDQLGTIGTGSTGTGVVDGDKGDIVILSEGTIYYVDSGSVSNYKLGSMPALTLKGNNMGATSTPYDLTVTQVKALLGYQYTDLANLPYIPDTTSLSDRINLKQNILVSGTNIKTVNGNSIVGSGDITLSSAVAWGNITGSNILAQTDLVDSFERKIVSGTTGQYRRGDKTWQTLDKTAVGLSNADNTSDADKPLSSATVTALALKQAQLVSGTNIKQLAGGIDLLGSGTAAAVTSLTTTGTDGVATFNTSTGVLNVPQYAGDPVVSFVRNVSRDSIILTLTSGTRFAVKDSAGGGSQTLDETLTYGSTSGQGFTAAKDSASQILIGSNVAHTWSVDTGDPYPKLSIEDTTGRTTSSTSPMINISSKSDGGIIWEFNPLGLDSDADVPYSFNYGISRDLQYTDKDDYSYTWGTNLTKAGGRKDSGQPSFAETIETQYEISGFRWALEHYTSMTAKDGTGIRPLYQIFNRDSLDISLTAISSDNFRVNGGKYADIQGSMNFQAGKAGISGTQMDLYPGTVSPMDGVNFVMNGTIDGSNIIKMRRPSGVSSPSGFDNILTLRDAAGYGLTSGNSMLTIGGDMVSISGGTIEFEAPPNLWARSYGEFNFGRNTALHGNDKSTVLNINYSSASFSTANTGIDALSALRINNLSTSRKWSLGADADKFFINNTTDSVRVLNIDNAGKFGIGSNITPDSLLTVSGGGLHTNRGVRHENLPVGLGAKYLTIDANGVIYQSDTAGIYGGGGGGSSDTTGSLDATLDIGNTTDKEIILNTAGAASTPALKMNGSIYTGGSATTTKPLFLIEPSGATSNAWSTSGTAIGINGGSGFVGNLIDAQVNGVGVFSSGIIGGESVVNIGPYNGVVGTNARINMYRWATDLAGSIFATSGAGISIVGYQHAIFGISGNGVYHTTNGTWMGANDLSNVAATARVHIPASTTAANKASLKINEGSRQTTPEDGTINYVSNNLEFVETSTVYILAKTLTTTSTLDFGSTAAGSSTDLTITLTGSAVGDAVMIGVPNGATLSNGCFTAWVSATNTITVRFSNPDLISALDPASGTFRVSIIKY
jgi:hypothetical protein